MTEPASIVYLDDTDAFVDRIVTNHTNTPPTFSPVVAVDAGAYEVTAAWQGESVAGPAGTFTRALRIPLVGIPAGLHRLYLQVPGGTDFELEPGVLVTTRT